MLRESIAVRLLRPGVWIELPLRWNEHPFLLNKFRIKDDQQVALIRSLGLQEVWFYPDKSRVQPLENEPAQVPDPDAAATEKALQQKWDEKKEQARRLNERRREILKVKKQFNAVIGEVKDLMGKMNSSPVQAMNEATKVVGHIVETLCADKEVLVHLMNANNLDDSMYYHVLNTSVLSLLVAREIGITDKEQLMTLGLAGLLHDIGNTKLPAQLLRKTVPMNKPETELYLSHVRLGVDLITRHAALKLTVKPTLVTTIEQHHVFLDGSGYPASVDPATMQPLSKILAMVNYYDELCNRNDPKQSMTPHEALSLMFSKQKAKFDIQMLQAMVKMLGIYPPGTVVQLSDESIAIVIYLNRKELLKPGVLVYSPDIPKADAVIVDLTSQGDLSIRKSIRPAELSTEEFEYLSPRERVSYFFTLTEKKPNT